MQHKPMTQDETRKQSNSFLSEQSPDKTKNIPKVRIDLRKTQYPLLSNVATNSLNWKIWSVMKQSKEDRDVIWRDTYVTEKQVKRLNSYQRINHFPGSQELGKKNLLAINLEKMRSYCQSFYPQTWILPRDCHKFKKLLDNQPSSQYYIAKPEALSQGKGIFLFNELSQLPCGWEASNLVVQRYIQKPFLLEGLKFDFRIYVLLRSISPLRIYVYKEGLARFATAKYQSPSDQNQTNTMMHLTNYAINKRSPDFVFNISQKDLNLGHKRSLTSVLELLRNMKINTSSLETQIDSIIVKSILSSLANLNESYKRVRQNRQVTSVCFEILGFDIIIDQNLTPFLIEVNHSPSFTTDSPLDYKIKKSLIEDTLKIIRVDSEAKKQFFSCKNLEKRTLDQQNKQLEIQQDEFQQNNKGGYRKIFPTKSIQLNYIYEQIMGVKSVKLHRVNFQNVNKNKISEIGKTIERIKDTRYEMSTISSTVDRIKTDQNKVNKYFPLILEISESARHNAQPKQCQENQKSKNQKYVVNVDESIPRKLESGNYSNKNIGAFSHNQFLKNKRILKFKSKKRLAEFQDSDLLKLNNLEIDFCAAKKQKSFKGSMICSSLKSPTKSPNYNKLNSSCMNNHGVHWTTRSIMMDYEKSRRGYSQQNQQELSLSYNLGLDNFVIQQTRVETETEEKDEKASEEPQSPIRIKTLCYQQNAKIKKPIKLREKSFIKPVSIRTFTGDKRRFSHDQRNLIVRQQ